MGRCPDQLQQRVPLSECFWGVKENKRHNCVDQEKIHSEKIPKRLGYTLRVGWMWGFSGWSRSNVRRRLRFRLEIMDVTSRVVAEVPFINVKGSGHLHPFPPLPSHHEDAP